MTTDARAPAGLAILRVTVGVIFLTHGIPKLLGGVPGDTLCLVVTSWSGPPEEVEEVFRPIREAGPIVAEHVGPMPYPALPENLFRLNQNVAPAV